MSSEVREPTYFVLTAMATGPLHGYGVIQQVEALSEGRLRLRPGTLYATLERLSRDGLIADSGSEVVNGRLRHYYRLTATGAELLATESERRLAVSHEALRRLRLAGG